MNSRKEQEVIKRNAELKQQLAANAHKLKIEAGLEKVRAVALKMKKPADMLEVCKTISLQLEKLGIKEIRNVQTAIFYESKGAYMNYEYYAKHKKTFITETVYTNHKIAKAFAAQMLKGKGEVYTTHIKGKKVKDWLAYQKTTNVFIDRFLEKANSLNYYWHSLGPVALGMSTYDPLIEEELNLFKRFLKVFELAYKRYMDIEQAMAQAREAQIEAALEKVRSRSLAMNRSDELKEVVGVVFGKLKELGFPMDDGAAVIMIFLEDSKDHIQWIADKEGSYPVSFRTPYSDHSIPSDVWNAKQGSTDFFSKLYPFREKNTYFKYLFKHSDYRYVPDEVKKLILSSKNYGISIAFEKNSAILIPARMGKLVSSDQKEILKRFAKVFEQSYTRFLDLQKAEAQTREAKIEAALERTRTQSMIMQHSKELDDSLRVFHEQILLLGIRSAFSFLWLPDEKNDRHIFWAAWGENKKGSTVFKSKAINYPLNRNEPATAQCLVDWKSNEPVYSYHVPPAAVKNYFAVWQELIDGVKHLKPEYFSGGLHYVEAFMKYGCFGVMVETDLMEDEKKILGRFAVEFERTYTRFLDLQKAEAQAREAKIEVALEKVRARSMAMHKSSELKDVARELRTQLGLLGTEELETCVINLYGEYVESIHSLAATRLPNSHGEITESDFLFPKKGIAVIEEMLQAYSSGVEECVILNEGAKSAQWMNVLAKALPDVFEIVAESTGFNKNAEIRVWWTCAFFQDGSLIMITMSPPDELSRSLLKRFASVFGMAYRRFADLKQAEAQAREAQIELGLERVRARAMAMQKSDELKELIGTVYNELTKLDLTFDRCLIWVMNNEDLSSRLWMANAESQPVNFYMPYHDNPPYLAFVKAWKDRNKRWQYDLNGQVKKEWDGYVFIQTEMKHLPEPVKKNMQATGSVILSGSFHNFGCLQTAGPEPLKDEQFDILNRFAKVFDLTYTRFNDLKQAEAQARESQIQLALERVRARTMAMQKSDELPETSYLLFQQVKELGLTAVQNSIAIINEDTGFVELSTTVHGHHLPHTLNVPIDDPYVMAKAVAALKAKHKSLKLEIRGQELKDYNEHRNSFFETKVNFPEDQWIVNIVLFSKGWLSFSSNKNISAETFDLLKRFAAVFEQTYIRFNDLKQAEAQAKESQIQLALERVRARTMAMQKSDELMETAVVLFDQLYQLGEHIERAIIGVMNEEERVVDVWATRPDGSQMEKMQKFPIDEPILMQKVYAAWRQEKKSILIDLRGEELESYFQFLKSRGPKLKRESFGERRVENFVFFSKGMLGFISVDPNIPANLGLYERFAAVFEQTYTRFLDLQKAEAQAREAQIQLGLERVRARAMAMQTSEELNALIGTVFTELTKLDLTLIGCDIIIFDNQTNSSQWWMVNSEAPTEPFSFFVKYHQHPPYLAFIDGWKQRKLRWVYDLKGNTKKEWDDFLFNETEFSLFPSRAIENMKGLESVLLSSSFNNFGCLNIGTREPLTEEHFDILLRFAKVFDLTYTRFNDLKQAEEQARESQIQLALERVRARTMAMQHSDELKNAAALLFQQVKSLGAPAYSCGYNIWEKEDKEFTSWMSTQDGSIINGVPNIPLTEDANFIRYVESKLKGEQFFVLELRGERMQEHYQYLKTIPAFKAFFDYALSVGFDMPETQIHHVANFSNGNLLFITLEPCPEFHDVFKRFAAVFEQTYTRFLDLQKAEAQARESQIELGLERVRARAMAMQKSDELSELVDTVFKELTKLDFALAWCIINIIDGPSLSNTVWAANPDIHKAPDSYHMKFEDYPFHDAMMKGYKEKKTKYIYVLEGEEKKVYDEYLFKETEFRRVPEEAQAASRAMEKYVVSFTFGNFGGLQTVGNEPLSDINLDILERFGKVFDLTYTRFNDLLKAEAQAREARIGVGLERVRSRSLAMHNTSELQEVIHTVHKELLNLNIAINGGSFIAINKDVDKVLCCWGSGGTAETSEEVRIPLYEHPFCTNLINRIKSAPGFFIEEYTQKEKKDFFTFLFKHEPWSKLDAKQKDETLSSPGGYTRSCYVSQHTSIFIINHFGKKFSAADNDILQRFGKVFEQAYTRFLDLQRAEAQAREAKIEAALEKVRASTMAMQKSNDLSTAAFVLFQQFKGLGEEAERIFIATFDDDERWVDLWGTNQGGNQLNKLFRAPVDEPTVISKIITAWKAKAKSVIIDLTGDELNKYVSFLKGAGIPVIEGIMSDRRVQTVACFSKGVIGLTTSEPRPQESIQLLERFAGVFDLTYTRFLDLSVAETKAHEARIEVALERVRARALAMQQPEELKDVAQVLRNEMGLLGVEELETSSIYIHPDNSEKVECWYALKDPTATEKRMVSDHFDLNLNDTWVGREMQKFYTSKENQTSIVMQGANRKEWIEYCYKHSPVFSGFYGETIPDRTYHLFKFSHGYIGAAAPGEISNESWRLLSRAASVFSLAYSRFKDLSQARIDLVKLKEEKKRAEDALTDLQVTQKQLVQAEKMASLGELTAGIAHEIQNPLNFVNNFSDVSNELLDEMKAELEKGNAEEAKLIAVDVKENLEKILHHGKRADAIVKGMLQHSRTNTGQKEPTDINVLAEEYLRLAYHGLRAKDKFFNAKFETDLDPSINKINIVPQEIGRVILNLINNSFYAVSEKKRTASNGYEPSVMVSTKKINDKVEIRVIDNGNGIPQKVLDKIFQPFFTTKPTGQGTGLGLSLSYDIVTKGHDGEIKVETKEGEGSAFTISLPMK